MIILLHVLVALSGLGYATYLLFAPKLAGFRIAYLLVGLTLASGTYITISQSSHILRACISGLAYLAFVASCLTVARYRLVKQASINKDEREYSKD